MTGGLLQLAAYGAEDLFLTGNPQITFFLNVYKRHTNFSIESFRLDPHGEVDFGKKFYFKLDRYGDLVNSMFLKIKLPALNVKPNENPNYKVSYLNFIGNAIIRMVNIEIGGQIIDTQNGHWLTIWNLFTTTDLKLRPYALLIGAVLESEYNLDTFPGPLELNIPLAFWFNNDIGRALPLIALQNQEVRINFEFREFNQLWMSTNGIEPGLGGPESSIMCDRNITEAYLYVDYIFLEDTERKLFAKSKLAYLIEQIQMSTYSITQQDTFVDLPFSHPIKDLTWVFHIDQFQNGIINKDLFNFSDMMSPPGDILEKMELLFENNRRFEERDAIYFRLIQPFQRQINVPINSFIYNYSFALKPADYQPTGTCNFSMIDHKQMHVKIRQELVNDEIQLIVFARGYNIWQIEEGLSGLVYMT
jgi:hypothetical protein